MLSNEIQLKDSIYHIVMCVFVCVLQAGFPHEVDFEKDLHVSDSWRSVLRNISSKGMSEGGWGRGRS